MGCSFFLDKGSVLTEFLLSKVRLNRINMYWKLKHLHVNTINKDLR